MLTINLLKEVGEFCKSRTDPQIPNLRDKIRNSITECEAIVIDVTGVKSITPSFIDQIFGELTLEFSPRTILKFCKFCPELHYSFKEQIERSARLRGWKNKST